MKNGTITNSLSPDETRARIQGARVQAGRPPRSEAGILSLCLHETASTEVPEILPIAAAAARRDSCAAGSSEPLSMRRDPHLACRHAPCGLEPGQLLRERCDLADDDHRGRLDPLAGGESGERPQRPEDPPVSLGRRRLHDRGRRRCRETARLEPPRDGREVLHAHVDAEGRVELGVVLPADGRVRLRRVLVPGEEDHGGAVQAVGEGNPRVRRGGERRGDPGDDLESDAGGGERRRLLAPAPEHERVAALEPDDRLPGKRQADEHLVDLVLGPADLPALLPHEHALASRRGEVEHLLRDKVVVHDDVGLAEDPAGLDRQELRVAGPSADEVDGSRGHISAPAPIGSSGFASPRASRASLSSESPRLSRSVRISRSGASGASYGESIPVNCVIWPARAFL